MICTTRTTASGGVCALVASSCAFVSQPVRAWLLHQVAKNDGSGEQVLMKSRRIDGATSLENREIAIKEFNAPDSGVFIKTVLYLRRPTRSVFLS